MLSDKRAQNQFSLRFLHDSLENPCQRNIITLYFAKRQEIQLHVDTCPQCGAKLILEQSYCKIRIFCQCCEKYERIELLVNPTDQRCEKAFWQTMSESVLPEKSI